jgi:hypothetical protein
MLFYRHDDPNMMVESIMLSDGLSSIYKMAARKLKEYLIYILVYHNQVQVMQAGDHRPLSVQ